jgi:hypothetical protein
MEMGQRAYARHRGVSLRAVQKALEAKRIFLNANGKIDSEVADRDWAENTDSSRVSVNVLSAATEQPAAVPDQLAVAPAAPTAVAAAGTQQTMDLQPPDGPVAIDDGKATVAAADRAVTAGYRQSRADRERYEALTKQLEYEKLVGSLISVEEAKRIAYTTFRALRDAVLNVVPRLKDQIAAINDPHQVELVLEEELAKVLGTIDVGKLLSDQDLDE